MSDTSATAPAVTTKSSAPAAVSTSAFATALAVVVCWYIHVNQKIEVPPEIAIAVAGVFTGVVNFIAVLISHFLNHRNDLT